MSPVGAPPCWIASTTGFTCRNFDGKKPIKTEDEIKCRAGMMPALHNRWGLWRVLGLSDDFDSGADGNNVVEVDHISVT